MASDEDYMAFLNKANQDADEAHAAHAATAAQNSNSSKTMLKALDAGEEAPKEIREVCGKAVYVSDADEPFEQVSLQWTGEGGLPDEGEFCFLFWRSGLITGGVCYFDHGVLLKYWCYLWQMDKRLLLFIAESYE